MHLLLSWRSRKFARSLWREFNDDRILDGAAVLAFFSVLAVFPAMILILALLPILSIPHLQQAILDLLHQVLPSQAARLFDGTIDYFSEHKRNALLVFSVVFTLWSASSGIFSLMEQLNLICDVTDRRPFWKSRGIAILLTLFFYLLTIVSLSLAIGFGAVQAWLVTLFGRTWLLLGLFATLRWIVLAAATLLAFAVAYRFGPDAQIRFRFLSPGNIFATVMVALISIGFRFYVGHVSSYSAMYGSLAAIIILMVWMYLAGIAVLTGCEIDSLLTRGERP
uniref:YihY/virulence factor BrkB family protein n=1 Tax=Acidobacterium capsulatum TaxID=33075 RepID=A0A7V4XQA7_9BACT